MTLPTSSREAFLRWRRERLPVLPFVGVAFVVCLCAKSVTVSSLLVSFVWLAAFRLVDDLFSEAHDAVHHPGRAVVRGPARLYLRAAVAAVVVGFIVAVINGSALFYTGLFFFLLLVSPTGALRDRGRSLLVLVKYPAIATALSTSTPSLWRLILLYLCVVVDEEVTGRLPLAARALPFFGAGLAFFLL